MTINVRERLIAAAIHFCITLAVASLAAAVVFLVWFPDAFADMMGGKKLFLMMLGVDLSLGPLISLVIYSSKKPRRELLLDYAIVGAVQLAALLYGTFAVAVSRPAFIVYHGARLEIVTAVELDDADLALGVEPSYRTRSWTGPRLVAVEMPTDVQERNNLIFSAVQGKDAQLMPRYYRDYQSARTRILEQSQPLDALHPNGADAARLKQAIDSLGLSAQALRWLQVRHRFGYSMALIDARTGDPVKFLTINPN